MLKLQSGAVRAVMDMSLFVLLLLSGLLCSASGFQREYYYVNTKMSWSDAQRYCRENYNYLATVDSMNDVNKMMNTVNDGYSGSVWIGLKRPTQRSWAWSMGNETLTEYSACLEEQNQICSVSGDTRWVWIGLSSDSWQWSDQWSLSFTNWAAGQPSASGDCVAMSTTDSGKWIQNSCVLQYPFICYEEAKFVKKQTVRFYFSHDGENSLTDSSLQTAIFNKISEKLSIGIL
ncbi:snaclec A10-like isoform X4 [Triplophysa rosa]|uniref:snaclec A10-like isoform X4 n=1 Tax=Triplophysa rosa TaxID=992332 RepID=UPI00254639E6|nr:snaclec A10-like isoform X4 [Triplophysa rosa]